MAPRNRLAHSQSPYLLQHADNPVDWYPWGEEAFAAARAADRPVFLSIGYSTCHWCHVMAHESFEDAEVAALMNEAFVYIKVDREERPDIDQVYMTVVSDADRQRRLAADDHHDPGPRAVLRRHLPPAEQPVRPDGDARARATRAAGVADQTRRRCSSSADEIVSHLQSASSASGRPSRASVPTVVDAAVRRARAVVRRRATAASAAAPKFPVAAQPALPAPLLAQRTGDCEGRWRWSSDTLDAMRRGGIFDQVGLRLPPLLDGPRVAGAALREDALRPGDARPWRTPRRYQATGTRGLTRAVAREILELRSPRPDLARGRLLLRRGRRQRRRRGPVLRVDLDGASDQILQADEADAGGGGLGFDPKGNFTTSRRRDSPARNILHLKEPLPR